MSTNATALELFWTILVSGGWLFVTVKRLSRTYQDWRYQQTHGDQLLRVAAWGRLRRAVERWIVLGLLGPIAGGVAATHGRGQGGSIIIVALVLSAMVLVTGSILDEQSDQAVLDAAERRRQSRA